MLSCGDIIAMNINILINICAHFDCMCNALQFFHFLKDSNTWLAKMTFVSDACCSMLPKKGERWRTLRPLAMVSDFSETTRHFPVASLESRKLVVWSVNSSLFTVHWRCYSNTFFSCLYIYIYIYIHVYIRSIKLHVCVGVAGSE